MHTYRVTQMPQNNHFPNHQKFNNNVSRKKQTYSKNKILSLEELSQKKNPILHTRDIHVHVHILISTLEHVDDARIHSIRKPQAYMHAYHELIICINDADKLLSYAYIHVCIHTYMHITN